MNSPGGWAKRGEREWRDEYGWTCRWIPSSGDPGSGAAEACQVGEGPLLLGEFAADRRNRYQMVVNRDFTVPLGATIVLRLADAAVREISKTTGAPLNLAAYSAGARTLAMSLAPGDGPLLQLR